VLGSTSSDVGSSHVTQQEDLDVFGATFACPDLTTFCRLDELGLEAPDHYSKPVASDPDFTPDCEELDYIMGQGYGYRHTSRHA
jgi:hypothetical protein